MTPSQVKESIRQDALHLLQRVADKKINRSCVNGIVERLCMDGARHNGIPEYWREYYPSDLLD